MEKMLETREIELNKYFNFITEESCDNCLDLDNINDDDSYIFISVFDDLKESLQTMFNNKINVLVLDHLNIIELCEILANTHALNKKLYIILMHYGNFDIAIKNIVNIFPNYIDNTTMISHILHNKFEQINKSYMAIFDFYLHASIYKNFFIKQNDFTKCKEVVDGKYILDWILKDVFLRLITII